ncbi:MAG: EAL domain-containing protein [Amphritea sp.]|nr:EAL domain-containing protein [Amphritea sp.]
MISNDQHSDSLLSLKLWAPALAAGVILLLVAQYSFLAFHTLAELFSIIVSFILFAVAWSTRRLNRNNFLLFLACGYFWVGSLDLLHTLTYKGMGIIEHAHVHTSVDFWISTRFLEAIILLLAPLAASRRVKEVRLFYIFGIIALLICGAIFSGFFPQTYIDGVGLTAFKINSEYLIDIILLIALVVLYRSRATIPQREKQLIAASIVMTMLAELAFTFYVSVYGLSNVIGHLFKLGSFWLIFHAVIISNLAKPYADLAKKERLYRRLFENTEVSLWDVDLIAVYDAIQRLKKQGVKDMRQYLTQQTDLMPRLATLVRIRQVNDATIKLFSPDQNLSPEDQAEMMLRAMPLDLFEEPLISIWNGESQARCEAHCVLPDGKDINIVITFQIPETREEFSSIPVSIVDITKHKKDEKRIWLQANFDELTGLCNRSYFTDSVSHAIDIAERQREKLALLYIDLDRFKQVNDTLGHSFGDILLQQTAERLQSSLRKTDIPCRLAGDEFAVLLPNTGNADEVEIIAHKLLQTLAAGYELKGKDAYISASIGIAMFPEDGRTVDELLRKADSAMYKAKEDGRNHYHFFTEELEQAAQRKRMMEQDLRRALDADEFEVYFQPVHRKDATLAGCEALVRWNHPHKGMVPPIDFIPLAEELNLIIPLGEQVLRKACAEAVRWTELRESPLKVGVNISCRQFQGVDMPALVAEVLNETGLPGDKLVLEITESLLIEDDDNNLVQLSKLRKMGVSLAVDDFGTGYSSLGYLKKFPVNILKIDRSFVKGLPQNTEDIALVNAIVSMARSLQMDVVAEGVETAQQLALLADRGCDYMQGFYLSKPLPADQFRNYIRDREQDWDLQELSNYQI